MFDSIKVKTLHNLIKNRLLVYDHVCLYTVMCYGRHITHLKTKLHMVLVYKYTARMYYSEKCTALNWKHYYYLQYNSLQSTYNSKNTNSWTILANQTNKNLQYTDNFVTLSISINLKHISIFSHLLNTSSLYFDSESVKSSCIDKSNVTPTHAWERIT